MKSNGIKKQARPEYFYILFSNTRTVCLSLYISGPLSVI